MFAGNSIRMVIPMLMLLSSMKKVEWGARKWDIDDHHGDYQQAKCWKAAEKYCQKDGDYISNFDVNAAGNKKDSGRALNKRLLRRTYGTSCTKVSSSLRSISSSKPARMLFSRTRLQLFLGVLALCLILLASFCLFWPISKGTFGFGH